MRKQYILLFALLMLCLLPLSVWAQTEGDFVYSVIDGQARITAYTGSAAELTIPDTLGGYPVTAIGYCAFRNCTALAQVTLCESVSSIGSNAFQNCFSLSRISLPGGLVSLGSHAFYGCSSLKQIALPDSLTRLHPYAFYGCSAIRSCGLDSRAALTLTSYGYAFTSPDYPQLALKAFEDEAGVRTFTVDDCDESAVAVSIPDGVTAIEGYAFCNCSSLAELVLPDSVTEIAYFAFEGCSALKQITLPGSVAQIADNAFSGCSGVTIISPAGSAAQALAQAHAEDGLAWRAL